MVKVNKIFTKKGQNSAGEDYTRYDIYGKKEDGSDFKASCFAPLGDSIQQGKTYTFIVSTKGKYANITEVKEEGDMTPAEKPATKPAEKKEDKPDWDKINAERDAHIFAGVAIKEASADMANILNLPGIADKVEDEDGYMVMKKKLFAQNLSMLKEVK